MKNTKRILLAAVAALLLVAVSVGGTFAWLTATTSEVKNTFTPSNINITLAETTGERYKMVPGATIAKDPKVTVEAGSEACWLFVKVEKSSNFGDFMTYEMATGWTELTEGSGVYYRTAVAGDSFNVLKGGETTNTNGQVTVKDTVTKEMMNDLAEATYPTLKFNAYAVQYASFEDNPAGAWAQVSTPVTP